MFEQREQKKTTIQKHIEIDKTAKEKNKLSDKANEQSLRELYLTLSKAYFHIIFKYYDLHHL